MVSVLVQQVQPNGHTLMRDVFKFPTCPRVGELIGIELDGDEAELVVTRVKHLASDGRGEGVTIITAK